MKISHSAVNKHSQCAKMYEYHYIRKIRPNWTSSALIFGDALDKALNELVMKTENDPYETFLKTWTNSLINKEPTYLPTASKLLYANKDYEPSLLTPEDYEDITARIAKGEIQEHNFSELVSKKKEKSWDSFTDDEKAFYNIHHWHCMKNKAKFMIEGYKKHVLPKITKVHCVQKEIKADNGEGDQLAGFIDLIADVEGYGTVILDHKTSARDYEWDSPSKSPQLALYMHMEGENYNTRKAGFIVLKKNLEYNKVKICNSCGHDGSSSRAKTCDQVIDPPMTGPGTGKAYRCNGEWNETTSPEAAFQILIQNMPEQFETLVVENIDVVTKSIKTGIFPKNLDSCDNHFGAPCVYKKYCHGGEKNMKGLCKNDE